MKIWFNGALVNGLTLPASNSSWLVGDGVFETIKTLKGKCFFLTEHLERLVGSLASLSMATPTIEDLERAVASLLAKDDEIEYGRLRITVFADGNTLLTHEEHLPQIHPLSLCRFPDLRASFSSLAKHKTISYAENFTALRYAKLRQCDDVLFINERLQVSESAMANLIFFQDGKWSTPTLASGCLPGITRRMLVSHFGVEERDILESELMKCEALALTSSLREVVEVHSYESKLYPAFKPLQQLQASFNEWARDKLAS